MSPATIHALGQEFRPLEYVATIGLALGLSKTAAYRAAKRWPTTGGDEQRLRVVTTALLDELGIAYTFGGGHDDA
jgi:hypothetical protein